jgi:pyrimidine deaminase RibD-like protein
MPSSNTDTDWMRRALAIAREADATPGKNPIGCVIVLNGRIIGEACNEVDLRHDATAHAEILAMGRAGATLQCNELRDAALYSTLQPCGMCTMARSGPKLAASFTVPAVMMCMKCILRTVISRPRISFATLSRTTLLWKVGFWRRNARLFTFRQERMCPRTSSSIADHPSTGSFAHKPEVPTSIEWPSGSRK